MAQLNIFQSIQTNGTTEFFTLVPTGAFKTAFANINARIFISSWQTTNEQTTPNGVLMGVFDSGPGKPRFQVLMNADGTVFGRYDKITPLSTANSPLSYNDGLPHNYVLLHNFGPSRTLTLAVDRVIVATAAKPAENLAGSGNFHIAGQSTGNLWPGLTTQVSAGHGTTDATQDIIDELNGVNDKGAGNPPDLTSPPVALGTVSWWELPGVAPATTIPEIVQNNGVEADLTIAGGINLTNVVNDFPSTVSAVSTGRIIDPIADPIASRIAQRYST